MGWVKGSDDDVYERKGVTAAVLMATPCTNSLGGESGEQRHEGCGGRSAC